MRLNCSFVQGPTGSRNEKDRPKLRQRLSDEKEQCSRAKADQLVRGWFRAIKCGKLVTCQRNDQKPTKHSEQADQLEKKARHPAAKKKTKRKDVRTLNLPEQVEHSPMQETLETLKQSEKRLLQLLAKSICPADVEKALASVRNAIEILEKSMQRMSERS